MKIFFERGIYKDDAARKKKISKTIKSDMIPKVGDKVIFSAFEINEAAKGVEVTNVLWDYENDVCKVILKDYEMTKDNHLTVKEFVEECCNEYGWKEILKY